MSHFAFRSHTFPLPGQRSRCPTSHLTHTHFLFPNNAHVVPLRITLIQISSSQTTLTLSHFALHSYVFPTPKQRSHHPTSPPSPSPPNLPSDTRVVPLCTTRIHVPTSRESFALCDFVIINPPVPLHQQHTHRPTSQSAASSSRSMAIPITIWWTGAVPLTIVYDEASTVDSHGQCILSLTPLTPSADLSARISQLTFRHTATRTCCTLVVYFVLCFRAHWWWCMISDNNDYIYLSTVGFSCMGNDEGTGQ